MLLCCHAVVPDTDERERLLSEIRHRNLPYREKGPKIELEAHFLTYRSINKVATLFENTNAIEYGITVIEDRKEVKNDFQGRGKDTG